MIFLSSLESATLGHLEKSAPRWKPFLVKLGVYHHFPASFPTFPCYFKRLLLMVPLHIQYGKFLCDHMLQILKNWNVFLKPQKNDSYSSNWTEVFWKTTARFIKLKRYSKKESVVVNVGKKPLGWCYFMIYNLQLQKTRKFALK